MTNAFFFYVHTKQRNTDNIFLLTAFQINDYNEIQLKQKIMALVLYKNEVISTQP